MNTATLDELLDKDFDSLTAEEWEAIALNSDTLTQFDAELQVAIERTKEQG